jgi:Ca2+-transporting ATPase
MNFFSNLNLLMVVALSFGIQVWIHHSAVLAKFLKTSLMSLSDCLMLLAISAVPLLALEAVKSFNRKNR